MRQAVEINILASGDYHGKRVYGEIPVTVYLENDADLDAITELAIEWCSDHGLSYESWEHQPYNYEQDDLNFDAHRERSWR